MNSPLRTNIPPHPARKPRPEPKPVPDSVRFAADIGNLTLYAKGRNNIMGTTGIQVSNWASDAVALYNITTKGLVSDCARLVLPIASIPELIAILERFYAGPLGRQALAVKSTTVEEK